RWGQGSDCLGVVLRVSKCAFHRGTLMARAISPNKALAKILKDVKRPGDFHARGEVVAPSPGLEVAGVGSIALPLIEAQARQIIAQARPAPYGRGAKTLVDREVRKVWQIEPAQLSFSEPQWPETLAGIVEDVAGQLGVAGKVEAELYKL